MDVERMTSGLTLQGPKLTALQPLQGYTKWDVLKAEVFLPICKGRSAF